MTCPLFILQRQRWLGSFRRMAHTTRIGSGPLGGTNVAGWASNVSQGQWEARKMHPSGSRSSKSSRPQTHFRILWSRRATELRALLSTFTSRQRALWHAGSETTGLPEGYLDDRSHLQKCCERALDAHTVEDAIFWHSEVINELSVEIYAISAKPWSGTAKERAIADLTELQSRHGAILHRLTGIVARNEQFVWQPQSVFKK